MEAKPRLALGSIVMSLAILMSACVTSAEADEGSAVAPADGLPHHGDHEYHDNHSRACETTTRVLNDCVVRTASDPAGL